MNSAYLSAATQPFVEAVIAKMYAGFPNGDGVFQFLEDLSIPCLVTNTGSGPRAPMIVYSNRAFTEMCGYEPDEIRGKSPKILQGEETDRLAAARFRQEIEAKGFSMVDLVNYKKDGTPYEVLILGGKLTREGSGDTPLMFSMACPLDDSVL